MAYSGAVLKSRRPEESAGYRIGLISSLAALIGILAGFIAYALYDLIGLITNLAYYHEWSFHFRSPEHTPIGLWIIVTPVIGGIIVGLWPNTDRRKSRATGFRKRWKQSLHRAAGLKRKSRS